MLVDHLFESNLLEVTPVRKKVVRKGRVIRKKDCPKGYKLVGGTRCVRIASRERNKRRRAGRRAARKGRASRARSRKRSLRIRKRRKLKKVKFR